MDALGTVLESRPYAGRGCLALRTQTGELIYLYFVTGRSDASRQREGVVTERGDVIIRDRHARAHDPLRHYVAGARRGAWLLVGNGDQVEPLAEALATGSDVLSCWAQHTYEPDPPIFTSRIWMARERGGAAVLVGYARRSQRGDSSTDRIVWAVEQVEAGTGVLMTTYCGTAHEVVSTHAPTDVSVAAATPAEALQHVWDSLDPTLRVTAFAVAADDPSVPAMICADAP